MKLTKVQHQHQHQHRRPRKKDFEGKTVKRFVCTSDNIWKIFFTDGTHFAIQSELHYGLPIMELCEVCSTASSNQLRAAVASLLVQEDPAGASPLQDAEDLYSN